MGRENRPVNPGGNCYTESDQYYVHRLHQLWRAALHHCGFVIHEAQRRVKTREAVRELADGAGARARLRRPPGARGARSGRIWSSWGWYRTTGPCGAPGAPSVALRGSPAPRPTMPGTPLRSTPRRRSPDRPAAAAPRPRRPDDDAALHEARAGGVPGSGCSAIAANMTGAGDREAEALERSRSGLCRAATPIILAHPPRSRLDSTAGNVKCPPRRVAGQY